MSTTRMLSPYNNGTALGAVVELAYHCAWAGDYTQIREFLSKPIVVERKGEKPADAAIQQIESRNYSGRLINYPEILLVGIT